ncbi:MAG: gas vesicle synthesis GvpLGvpF, partial [bacterium]
MVEPMVNNSGKYLYTIIADNTPKDIDLLGIGGSKVYTISNGRIAAVVSDITSKKIRPERRNLATHQTVIKHLMKDCTPLPVAFGVIANDE